MTNAELLELVITSIPYPEQIKNLDITTSDSAIRFDWRSSRYRVSKSLMVEEVDRGCLCGSDNAILMEHLIKKSNILRKV